jgi:glycopeptide antibiotics resistance protein
VIGLWVVPFTNYYYGSEYHAFTEICRKWMLGIPIGAFLSLAMPRPASRSIARLQNLIVLAAGVALFGTLEAGQLFLPARLADVTDVLIAVLGVETGAQLIKRLLAGDLLSANAHSSVKTMARGYPTALNRDPAGG